MKHRNIPNSDNWETPKELYDTLNNEFHFNFDPCPLNSTFDGLSIPWGTSNYVNPPYSRKLKEAFIRKGVQEHKLGKTVVFLLPVSTSTKIFHELLYNKAEIRFLRGRVRFRGVNTFGEYVTNKCGQHDSMIVIFRGDM